MVRPFIRPSMGKWRGKGPGRLVSFHLHGHGLAPLDGIGAIRRIRGSGCLTPIVALTGKALVDEKQDVFHAGCNGFLAEAISPRRA